MKNHWKKIATLALVLTLAVALVPAAGAKGKATCEPGTFEVKVNAVTADVNGALGTSYHYPVIQVVADFGDVNADTVYGGIEEWGPKEGNLEFAYDADAGVWKTEPLANPTPTETLHVHVVAHVGGELIGHWENSCTTWSPLLEA